MTKNNWTYIHGEYVKQIGGDAGSDAYVSILKNVETGESKIQIVDNPECSIYIAKPQYRQNTVKTELMEKSKLDMYRCRYLQIPQTIWAALQERPSGTSSRYGFRTPPGYIQPKKMLSSPYVYGADIDMGVHIKLAYNRANGGRMPVAYNTGFLDIETDVNGSEQIILITFMNGDGETYVGILREFFLDHTIDEVQKMWDTKVEPSFRSKLNKDGIKAYAKAGIHLNLKICDDEVSLIRWIFENIHKSKPDFIGIWNIAYDIPFILKRLEFRGVDPCRVFCSPEIPYRYRRCTFKEDKGKKDGHIVDRWSWLHCTAYTRWIDYMCLYGRLRKAKPREPSYKLDAIGGKEIGSGKLEFGEGDSHSSMQLLHQVEYTVYNIVDVLIMRVMEMKNQDFRNMMMLIGVSTLDCFAHQSIQLKNYFYDYLDGKGCVPASIGDPIFDTWDKYIQNKGGAVLSPDKADIAVPVLIEDDVKMRASRDVCDIDVSSMYPSLLEMMNCAKETKLATVLAIDNTRRNGKVNVDDVILDPALVKGLQQHDVIAFFADAIYTEANAIAVAQRFNLPDFAGVDAWMAKNFPGVYARAHGQNVDPKLVQA